MGTASTENLEKEKDKTAFEDELKRSVILSMNEQIEDQSVSTTADSYKTHIELLTKRLKSNCRQTLLYSLYDWTMFIWIKTKIITEKETVHMYNETFA